MIRAAIDRALTDGIPYELELQLRTAKGREIWVKTNGKRVVNSAGLPGLRGSIQDITARVEADHALRASEEKYRTLFESASEGMCIIQGGRFISVNQAALRMLGYDEAAQVLNKRPSDLSPTVQPDGEDSAIKEQRILKESLNNGTRRFEWEHLRANGSTLPVEVTLTTVELRGEPAQFLTWRDLTEQRVPKEREIQARIVFDNTSQGIIITDPERRILAVNRAFTEITGYSEEQALGKTPSLLQSGRHDEAFYQAMWATLEATGQWRGEFWNRRSNGDIYPQLSTISVVCDQAGRLTNYIAVFGDITQLKRSEEELYRLAHRDALTGLPNRALLRARLEQSMSRASRRRTMLAILFLDLDLFKNVNDTLGHPVGDALLQSVAAAMQSNVRAADSIARLGGDEFVVVMEDVDDPNMAAQLSRRLLDIFARPFDAEGRKVHITASIGISIFPLDGQDMDALLSNADVAMYQAKKHGRNTYRFFESAMAEGAMERLRLESALRGALARNEMTLVFQPQVKLSNRWMYGAEVLLRWHHPELGQVPPASFIPVAEGLGLIAELGAWVLEQACLQLAEWDRKGFLVPRLAVNLSVQQLERGDLLDSVRSTLARAEIEADRLELEVTESVLMRHADQVISNLWALRELGATIAVDDFGSGFSSLGYLKTLPVNRLKIDKSFIDNLTQDPNDDAIARAIIALGRGLGLDVLAEGVETEAQAEFLRQEQCIEAQGYLFGRPMTSAQLMDFESRQMNMAKAPERPWRSQPETAAPKQPRRLNRLMMLLTNALDAVAETPRRGIRFPQPAAPRTTDHEEATATA